MILSLLFGSTAQLAALPEDFFSYYAVLICECLAIGFFSIAAFSRVKKSRDKADNSLAVFLLSAAGAWLCVAFSTILLFAGSLLIAEIISNIIFIFLLAQGLSLTAYISFKCFRKELIAWLLSLIYLSAILAYSLMLFREKAGYFESATWGEIPISDSLNVIAIFLFLPPFILTFCYLVWQMIHRLKCGEIKDKPAFYSAVSIVLYGIVMSGFLFVTPGYLYHPLISLAVMIFSVWTIFKAYGARRTVKTDLIEI